MIPFFLSVHTRYGHGRSFRVWIPLFLVWLLLLPLLLVLFPVVLVAGLFVQINAFRLYGTVWKILSSMKNTLVEVENEAVAFRFRIT